jgi:hypothetical protein
LQAPSLSQTNTGDRSDISSCGNKPQVTCDLFFINIGSIRRNLDDLCIYLRANNIKPAIIAISEIWINSYELPLYPIDGYHMFGSALKINRADGVLFYVHESVACEGIILDFIPKSMSYVIIRCSSKLGDVIYINIYRQQAVSRNIFYDELENLFDILPVYPNTTVVICGDVNLDIAQSSKIPTSEIDSYMNLLSSHGFTNLFTSYTRITAKGASCIDHCYVKNFNIDQVRFDHLDTQVKDHLATIVSFGLYSNLLVDSGVDVRQRQYYTSIDYGNAGILLDIYSDIFMNYDDSNPNYLSENFSSSIATILKTSTIVKYPSSNKTKLKSWMTAGILKSIRVRNRLGSKRFHSPELMSRYQEYAASIKILIARAKSDYLNSELNRFEGDSRKTWKCVNDYLYGNKGASRSVNELVVDGDAIVDPIKIANTFNDYFSTLGERTVAAMAHSSTTGDVDITPPFAPSSLLNIPIPNAENIIMIIDKLKNSSHIGHDGLSNYFVKNFKIKLAPLIVKICSAIILTGIFPNNLKISKIIPLLKKGHTSDISNYRPISLSPILAKIVERYINGHLYDHLEKINAFPSAQYGFRRHRGCEDAVHSVVREICSRKNKKNNRVATTFFDFSKAFDTVPHTKLLRKLQKLGVNGTSLQLFESYLSQRQVFTEICGVSSDLHAITRGVPQGGCLSSTLFNAFTSDIQYIKLNGKLSLFADDSNIVNSAKSNSLLKTVVEQDLTTFANWCNDNELCLNWDKTMILLTGKFPYSIDFNLHNSSCSDHNNCLCPQIRIVKQCKYLGIILDSSLTFQFHVDALAIKLRRAIAALYKLSYLNRYDISLQFFYACFQSHIDYCSSVWGNLTTARCNKLLILQKHALRIIYQKSRTSPSKPLFCLSKVLPFTQRFLYRVCLFVFKMMMRREIINNDNASRHHITGKLLLPVQHCRMFTRSMSVLAIRIYNWCGAAMFDESISKFKKHITLKIDSLMTVTDGLSKLINGCWAA